MGFLEFQLISFSEKAWRRVRKQSDTGGEDSDIADRDIVYAGYQENDGDMEPCDKRGEPDFCIDQEEEAKNQVEQSCHEHGLFQWNGHQVHGPRLYITAPSKWILYDQYADPKKGDGDTDAQDVKSGAAHIIDLYAE